MFGKKRAMEDLKVSDYENPYKTGCENYRDSIGSSIAWEASAKEFEQSDTEADQVQPDRDSILHKMVDRSTPL